MSTQQTSVSRSMVDALCVLLRAGVTAEEALTACLTGIRARYAGINDTPLGDYYTRWAKALPDERPIIVVSVLGERSVGTWMMDPTADHAVYARANYHAINDVDVSEDLLTYAETRVQELVSWMWREAERVDHLGERGEEWLPPEQRKD